VTQATETTLRPGGFHLTAYYVLIPVLIGAAFGVLVGSDPFLGCEFPIRSLEINRYMPFVYSTAISLLLLCGTLCYIHRDWLFARRFELILAIVLITGAVDGLSLGRIGPTDFGFCALFLFWLLTSMFERRPIKTGYILICLLTFLFSCCLISVVVGGFRSMMVQHTILNKIFILFALTCVIHNTKLLHCSIRLLLGVAVISAIIGITSVVLFKLTGVEFSMQPSDGFLYKETPWGTMLRATGLLTRTQVLAHLLVIAGSIALFMPVRVFWKLAVLAVISGGLIATFSLGACLTLFINGVIWLFMHNPRKSIHTLVFLTALVLAAYLSGGLEKGYVKFKEIGSKQAEDRIEYLNVGLNTIAQNPYFGLGFKQTYRKLHTYIHTAYFQSMTEIGILGGCLLMTLIFYLTFGSGRLIRKLPDSDEKEWCKGLFLGMVGLGLHLNHEPFFDNYMTWVYMGITAAAIQLYNRPTAVALRVKGMTGPRRLLLDERRQTA
jgi:hypothetical protein